MDPTIPPACGSCAEEATMRATRHFRIWSLGCFGLLLAAPALSTDEPTPAPGPAEGVATEAPKPPEDAETTSVPPTQAVVEGEVVPGVQYYLSSDNRDSAKFLEYREVPN